MTEEPEQLEAPEEDEAAQPEPDPRGIVALAIVVEGGLILLAFLLGWLVAHPPLDTFRFEVSDAALGLAATLPLLLMFFLAMRYPLGPFAPIKRFCTDVIRPIMAPCTLLDLAGISVLAGLGEEMLFRGVFQGAFASWTDNVWIGLLLASVLFGCMHAVTLGYAVLATLMGAYLGWLCIASDNLLLAVIAHALYDFIALVVIVRGPTPTPRIAPHE